MPSYLDFDSTKGFRDKMLQRTLDPVYGKNPSPKTFKKDTYPVQNLGDSQNLNLPDVDKNRKDDLSVPKNSNIFKPTEYFIKDTIDSLPRRANLSLYPYFTQTNENLIGIMGSSNYDTESELFKFAAHNIKDNPQGPVRARIQQNLYNETTAKLRVFEAINGNTTTLVNIIRGREPLIEGNNRITVNNSLLGKGVDFLQSVAGVQFPWTKIPGDYLSNPRAPINVRPTENISATTRVWQDLTGTLGSIVGIQRRPLPSRKPSDLLIEYMGSSSKNRLFDLLSYSKYAPNYTTGARSQQSSRLFQIPGLFAQGIKSLLGTEAPSGIAYIGDDRSNDLKLATTDLFSGRPVRSSYYLSLMFDPIAAVLFHKDRNVTEQGKISGNLTWLSKNKSQKGVNTDGIADSQSTNFTFRPDSILETTQQILDSKPQNGKDALAHIGHILDQTSRYFEDGGTLISRGSGVRYMDNSGRDIGVEFARVWTKDRPYGTYASTAPYYKETQSRPFYTGTTTPYRRTTIRKFDSSVLSNTWNLNIAPMSDGSKGFVGSTNIVPKTANGKDFHAKKYMLSIENLAWKTSTLPGYTVSDLPYSERGPNGGRVMWFPPYDLKVSEQNTANWDRNVFLGRPEPIYTFQNTERSGTLSFKVIVDHPSILNLLVREHFKLMSEEQVDQYINAFFAGAKDIDFYSLIRTYTNLDSDDVEMIQNYLNGSGDKNVINNKINGISGPVTTNPEGNTTKDGNSESVSFKGKFYYSQGFPEEKYGVNPVDSFVSNNTATSDIDIQLVNLTSNVSNLDTALTIIINGDTQQNKDDKKTIFNNTEVSVDAKENIKNSLTKLVNGLNETKSKFLTTLNQLKSDLEKDVIQKDVVINIGSSSSSADNTTYNHKLSLRRTHAVIKDILDVVGILPMDKWTTINAQKPQNFGVTVELISYTFKELGYKGSGTLYIKSTNYGEQYSVDGIDCSGYKLNDATLRRVAPVPYGCRQSTVMIDYKKNNQTPTSEPVNQDALVNINLTGTRPPIDVMKRIIMKTLSEEYYFKKLEETSPLVFGSLKEKLKYFHPGFHSMTPEGLNSRLTFLHQCLRPGNTLPVKGISDDSDLNARNTTFGPPPICIMRVGDFYHSKVIIRDLNITFDDTTWDLNPEGIGVQPMIANVTLQLNFIGGQGLEKPIERLQNALSSNFYANTEMYDERSETTNTTMGGKKTELFTKEFINSLNDNRKKALDVKDKVGLNYTEGQYIGEFSGETALNYTKLVDDLYKSTINYFDSYEKMYNNVVLNYGSSLSDFLINRTYRRINKFTVNTAILSSDIELFGLYDININLDELVAETRNKFIDYPNSNEIHKHFGLENSINPNDVEIVNEILYDYYIEVINDKFDNMLDDKYISEFEKLRNSIITNLDKLNYVTKNELDVKIQDGKAYTASLTSFDKLKFYGEYSDCITYFNDNTSKLYENLDSISVNYFPGLTNLTDDSFKKIISNLFYDKKDVIVSRLGFESDFMLSDETIKTIGKELNRFFEKPKSVNFKFSKKPKRKNNTNIVFPINLVSETNVDEDVKNLFASTYNINKIGSKLNYYKI